jgi:hypothetical protein
MKSATIRLLVIFFLALVASVSRGDKTKEAAAPSSALRPTLAGFGFITILETPKREPTRTIYSEEEVEIVESTVDSSN